MRICVRSSHSLKNIFKYHFRDIIAKGVTAAHPKPSLQEYINSVKELFDQGTFCAANKKFCDNIERLLAEFDVN